ncbi:hypothetical protein MAJ_05499, partial [Metarhizium majus ARSEF 297]
MHQSTRHIIMSVLSVLVFIAQGTLLRRGHSKKSLDDATYLELFSRILVGQEKCSSKLSAALEQGLSLNWADVYDFVDPFGDPRGASLKLARERLLTLKDFEVLSSPRQTFLEQQSLPGPHWEPKLGTLSRVRAFIGQVLRDFAFAWRHVLRRPMNTTTFMKLAYATIWILRMDFTILERIGFEYVDCGGPYVQLTDLPSWDTPEATLVQAGSSWFALSRDGREGLEMVQRHVNSILSLRNSTTTVMTYAILTLRQVILCKADGNGLVWTRSETLFGDIPASDTAIDMVLWAANTTSTEPQPSSINGLPIEIQDRILYYATASSVASAKLGCELGLGSAFSWDDRGEKIGIEETKRHRSESSPVESQIAFNGVMSGLSYKRKRGYQAIRHRRTRIPLLE